MDGSIVEAEQDAGSMRQRVYQAVQPQTAEGL